MNKFATGRMLEYTTRCVCRMLRCVYKHVVSQIYSKINWLMVTEIISEKISKCTKVCYGGICLLYYHYYFIYYLFIYLCDNDTIGSYNPTINECIRTAGQDRFIIELYVLGFIWIVCIYGNIRYESIICNEY